MTGRLEGRTALVTGAGVRVGRAIALALANEGARVAVHYNGSERGAQEVVKLIRASAGEAEMFQCDLSAADGPAWLAGAVRQRFGPPGIVVNSASIMEATPLDTIDQAQWERVMSVNFRAPFFLALEAARGMRAAEGDRVIVNIGDLAAFETWGDYMLHGLSKAGVVAMTRSLAKKLAPDIRVNCVAPGAVLLPEGWPEEERRKIIASTPLRRIGDPDDVAQAVIYLATATYVTGEVLIVDGGRRIRL